MKNIFKISLLAVMLFTSTIALATENNFYLKARSEKSVAFFINESQDVELSINGAEEGVIYIQKIHTSKPVTKVYDLAEFPDGNYTFELETKSELTIYNVQIKGGKTFVSAPEVTEFFKPVLTKENGLITLNLVNDQNYPIQVEVFNENNDKLYDKLYIDKKDISQKFSIKQTDVKELTFVINSKTHTYRKTIEIN